MTAGKTAAEERDMEKQFGVPSYDFTDVKNNKYIILKVYHISWLITLLFYSFIIIFYLFYCLQITLQASSLLKNRVYKVLGDTWGRGNGNNHFKTWQYEVILINH